MESYEKESVHEKCPAFKDGCPYSKLAQDLFMEEIKKCPEFKQGCPFKNTDNIKDMLEELSKMPESKHHTGAAHEQLLSLLKAVHSESKALEQQVGECPVFKTKEGCPFKDASKEGKYLIEPPAAVLESLTASDISKLKEKCPAFKEGCPFAKMDNEALLEEIKKCPEFKEGCAFKDAKSVEEIYSKMSQMPSSDKDCHHKEALMQTMKVIHSVGHEKADECPVLQKEGCPFKTVESEGKPLINPPEAVLPTEEIKAHPVSPSVHSVGLTDLKETCPAFESGCPFAEVGGKDFGKELKECPEFKNGCPFKDSADVGGLYKRLADLPQFSVEGSHGAKLLDIFKHVHEVSHSLKDELGECPVFVTDEGCPFKTVCSDGKPLIHKLDGQRWTKILESSIDDMMQDMSEEIEKSEPSIQLSKELKKGTKMVHREAENVHFVKEFAKGRIEKQWYKELLADLYFVYRALEEESEKHKDHELFKAVHFPNELGRLQSLEEDMEFYFGSEWKQVPMSDATQSYVKRIHEVGDKDPSLLIAHHYTRYLGDLSGGRILRKVAVKAMDLPSTGEGVKFFTFENIPDVKKFKNMYRSRLDELQIDKVKSDEIVKEANYVFLLNIYLFQEIDESAGIEDEQPRKKKKLTIEEIHSAADETNKEAPGVCPFATIAKKPEQTDMTASKQEGTSINPVLLAVLIAVAAILIGLVFTKMK